MDDLLRDFLEKYVLELRKLRKPDDLKGLYQWFWEQKSSYPEVTNQMNEDLCLKDETKLESDLPVLGSGKVTCFGKNRKGTLLLSVNPAWIKGISQVENNHCLNSLDHYMGFQLEFFSQFPAVMGIPNRFWNEALEFFRVFHDWDKTYGVLNQDSLWKLAACEPLLGGWELFPFHSHQDGLSWKIHKKEWLRQCMIESSRAAKRMGPKVLFIASAAGAKLSELLFPSKTWKHDSILSGTGNFKTSISYDKHDDGLEIYTVNRQVFSSAFRPPREQLSEGLRNLKQDWGS